MVLGVHLCRFQVIRYTFTFQLTNIHTDISIEHFSFGKEANGKINLYSVVVGITCSHINYSIKFSILLIIFIGILHSDRKIVKFWEMILIKNRIKFSKQLVIFNNVYVKLMVKFLII